MSSGSPDTREWTIWVCPQCSKPFTSRSWTGRECSCQPTEPSGGGSLWPLKIQVVPAARLREAEEEIARLRLRLIKKLRTRAER